MISYLVPAGLTIILFSIYPELTISNWLFNTIWVICIFLVILDLSFLSTLRNSKREKAKILYFGLLTDGLAVDFRSKFRSAVLVSGLALVVDQSVIYFYTLIACLFTGRTYFEYIGTTFLTDITNARDYLDEEE